MFLSSFLIALTRITRWKLSSAFDFVSLDKIFFPANILLVQSQRKKH